MRTDSVLVLCVHFEFSAPLPPRQESRLDDKKLYAMTQTDEAASIHKATLLWNQIEAEAEAMKELPTTFKQLLDGTTPDYAYRLLDNAIGELNLSMQAHGKHTSDVAQALGNITVSQALWRPLKGSDKGGSKNRESRKALCEKCKYLMTRTTMMTCDGRLMAELDKYSK